MYVARQGLYPGGGVVELTQRLGKELYDAAGREQIDWFWYESGLASESIFASAAK